MPNGTNRPMSDEASVNIGALQQRVYGLEQAIGGISQQIGSLASKIDARGQTNWGVLISIAGFSLAFAGAVGGLAYLPIRENQADLKLAMIETNKAMTTFTREFVTVRELDARSSRTRAEIDRLNTDLNAQEVAVRRAMELADANLQRQVDDQKKAFGDTFSLRDALLQMQRRIDFLEGKKG